MATNGGACNPKRQGKKTGPFLKVKAGSAVEDYVRARTLAGSESLSLMASEYGKMFGKIVRRATVPEVVAELLKIREQDSEAPIISANCAPR